MAMITCPECGKQISDKATACPNCGAALSAAQTAVVNNGAATAAVPKRRKKKVWIPIVIIAVILCIIAAIMVPSRVAGMSTAVTNKPYAVVYAEGEATGSYTGDWQSNRPNGTGTIIFEDNIFNFKSYTGDLVNGAFSGHRKMTYGNGDIYEGGYKDGTLNGHGKITFSSGEVLEGEFKNGEFIG